MDEDEIIGYAEEPIRFEHVPWEPKSDECMSCGTKLTNDNTARCAIHPQTCNRCDHDLVHS